MSTYTPIATQTLGSAAASVTFSSIPQGYTDLIIVQSSQTSAGGYTRITFNSDTGSNYSNTQVYGTGATAGTSRTSSLSYMQTGYNTASVQVGHIYQIMNYSNSTTYKTALTRWNDTSDTVGASVGLWRSTSAINSITLTQGSGNYNTGTTFSIYGIQVGNPAAKAQGGNIVTSDGTYMYHAFTSSGSFIPNAGLSADVLVIAGGGGGGKDKAGGGGAGGVCYQTSRSLTAKSYPIIIGAGGTGSIGYTSSNPTGGSGGSNGSNSIFDTITSLGGGLGATDNTTSFRNGASGGSGGGATRDGTIGSANQGNSGGATGFGNNGGAGFDNGNRFLGGGGGGAGAVGTSATNSSTLATGGAGVNTYSSWASATGTGVSGYYAGGGGAGGYSVADGSLTGGIGGAGGGGNGGNFNPNTVGSNAVTNTGSGGGGGGDASNGGQGGSGIVIIRYAL
jgi:hypothetical protein